MKTTLLLFVLILCVGCGARVAETPKSDNTSESSMTEPTFDSALAARLGADDYGMKAYIMVYLLPGNPAASDSLTPERNQELQMLHLKHLFAQAEEGKMVLVGPMMRMATPDTTQNPNSALRSVSGICVYDCSYEEAKMRANADPRVIAGQLVVECYPWYGSAALGMVPEVSEKITKKSVMGE